MPYIDQKLRPPFNELLENLSNFATNHQAISEALRFLLEGETLKVMDGCVNYFISKMLLNYNSDYKHTIQYLLIDIYEAPESYFGYERENGLLHSIQDEFKRRKLFTRKTEKLVKFLIKRERVFQGMHEDYKREINGDIL